MLQFRRALTETPHTQTEMVRSETVISLMLTSSTHPFALFFHTV